MGPHHTLFGKMNLGWGGSSVLPLSPSEGPWYRVGAVDHTYFHSRAQDGSVSGIQVKMRVKLGEKASCAWSCSPWVSTGGCWGRMPHTRAESAGGGVEQKECKGVTSSAKAGMWEGPEAQESQFVIHRVSHGWWVNSQRIEARTRSRLPRCQVSRKKGEKLGLLAWADFSNFCAEVRRCQGWKRKCHHLSSQSSVGCLPYLTSCSALTSPIALGPHAPRPSAFMYLKCLHVYISYASCCGKSLNKHSQHVKCKDLLQQGKEGTHFQSSALP